VLRDSGIDVALLKPANCGFDVAWSPFSASVSPASQ
jgi:predicted flavoprotein YhiN